MTTPEFIQLAGLLLEAVFIPLFLWLGKALINLHIDVQSLLRAVKKIEEQLIEGETLFDGIKDRLTKVEARVGTLEDKFQ